VYILCSEAQAEAKKTDDGPYEGSSSLHLLSGDIPGQEGFEVIGAGGLREFGKEAREIRVRLDVATGVTLDLGLRDRFVES
jgi:hypothetical protein